MLRAFTWGSGLDKMRIERQWEENKNEVSLGTNAQPIILTYEKELIRMCPEIPWKDGKGIIEESYLETQDNGIQPFPGLNWQPYLTVWNSYYSWTHGREHWPNTLTRRRGTLFPIFSFRESSMQKLQRRETIFTGVILFTECSCTILTQRSLAQQPRPDLSHLSKTQY